MCLYAKGMHELYRCDSMDMCILYVQQARIGMAERLYFVIECDWMTSYEFTLLEWKNTFAEHFS